MAQNDEPATDRGAVLQAASDAIHGERRSSYGDADESFGRIAKMWEAILGHPVTAREVALCMIALKLGRLTRSPNHEDSWVDIAGYAALGGEMK